MVMTNYEDGGDNGDDNGNEEGNNYGKDDNNASSGSGSDGPIFEPIITPRSCGGGSGNNGGRRYGCGALYIYPIKTLLKMCHKLLYVKFGVLDWCRCYMKKKTVQLMRE